MNDRKRVIAFVAALTMLSSTFTPIYADQIDVDLADIMEDTLVLGYSQTAEWCTWDEDNYVLTLHGQLPDTAYGNSIAEQAGVSASAVKKVVIEANTTAGAIAECMFFNMTDLTEIEGLENLDTSSVTSMMAMFSGCSSLTSLVVIGFDTSSVTSMRGMFESCSSLTSLDLSGFDTSSVTDMGNMFYGCSSLTSLDLTMFDTSSVTDMGNMFSGCSSLTSLDLSGFDTSSVENMGGMFSGCSSLTSLDMSSLNTASVTDMSGMFSGCSSLTSLDMTSFDTASVQYMGDMFSGCSSLTSLDVTSFDTASVTDMSGMFYDCSSLTSLDVTSFDTASVTDMGAMFSDCSSLTSVDVSGLDTSSVTYIDYMFSGCKSLTSLDLSVLDTSSVQYMGDMFSGCSSLTSLDLSSFDTSSVKDMGTMFDGCSSLESIIVSDSWDTSSVTSSDNMFTSCTALVGGAGTTYDYNHTNAEYARIDGGEKAPGYLMRDPSKWYSWNATDGVLTLYGQLPDTGGDTITAQAGVNAAAVKKVVIEANTTADANADCMFAYMSSLTEIEGLDNLDTSSVTSMNGMFSGCESLTSLDLSGLDTSSVRVMGNMFSDCSSLTSLDLSGFDTSNVIMMIGMFDGCSSLESIIVSDGWDTSSVTSSDNMFTSCESLVGGAGTTYDENHINKEYARIDGGEKAPGYLMRDPSKWYSWNATDGVLTLYGQLPDTGGSTITDQAGINAADVKKVVIEPNTTADANANCMFAFMSSLTEIEGLDNLDTSFVTSMISMFDSCTSLTSLDLSGFDTSSVDNMMAMFAGCSSLKSIIVSDSWDTSNVQISGSMFIGCESLVGGAGTTHDAYHTDAEYARIDGGASNPGYLMRDPSKWYSWNATEGVLTLHGQLPDTGGSTITDQTGVNAADVKKVVIEPNTKADANADCMFANMTDLTEIEGLDNLDTSSVTDMRAMFYNCSSLSILDVTSFDTSSVTSMIGMFEECSSLASVDMSGFDTSSVTDMDGMFYGCTSLASLDLSSFDTSSVTDMSGMFYGCSSLKSIIVSDSWDTSNVQISGSMFTGCESLVGGAGTAYDENHTNAEYARIDGGEKAPGYLTASAGNVDTWYTWDEDNYVLTLRGQLPNTAYGNSIAEQAGVNAADVKKVVIEPNTTAGTSTAYMFCEMSSLTEIEGLDNLDTSSVTSMISMFDSCTSLTSLDLSGFDTSSVTDMDGMFYGCTSLRAIKLADGTNIVSDMYLVNTDGWSKAGETAKISGTGEYAVFTSEGGWYVRASAPEYSTSEEDGIIKQTITYPATDMPIAYTITGDSMIFNLNVDEPDNYVVYAAQIDMKAFIKGTTMSMSNTMKYYSGDETYTNPFDGGYDWMNAPDCFNGSTVTIPVQKSIDSSGSGVLINQFDLGNLGYSQFSGICGANNFTVTLWYAEKHEHSYGEPEWTWAEDGSGASAKFTCTANDDEQNVTASVELIDSQDATCTAAGYKKYKGTVTFENNSYYDEYTVTIPATGHSYGEPVWTWAEDGSGASAKFTCTANDDEQNVTASVELIDSQDATCTAAGYKKYKGTVTFENNSYYDEYTVTIPATGHSYGEPVWTWAEDGSGASAKFTCTANDDEQNVTASVELIDSQDATCTADGYRKYKGTVTFENNSYYDEYTVTINATGHSYGEPVWTWAEDGSGASAKFTCTANDDEQNVTASVELIGSLDATCTADGYRKYKGTVTFENNSYYDEYTVTIPATGHSYGDPEWTWAEDGSGASAKFTCTANDDEQNVTASVELIDSQDATCTAAGYKKYKGTVTFENNSYYDEYTVTINATGHSYGEPVWTWAEDGSGASAKFTCTANDDEQNVTASVELIDSLDATCTAAGYKKYKGTVTFENNSYYDEYTVTINATGHSYGEPEWTWAEDGSGASAKFTCIANDDEQNVTASVELIGSQDATCTAAGYKKYKGTVTFENNSYYDEYTVTINATGHSYGEPEWTWAEDGSGASAKFTCTANDDEQNVTASVELIDSLDATCTAAGYKKYKGTVTFENNSYYDEYTVTIPATGHSYGEPVWTWAEDGSGASAKFTCTANDDEQNVTATVKLIDSQDATCTADGYRKYKGTVTFENNSYYDEYTVTINAPGHSYGEPEWTWEEDGSGASAKFTCTANDDEQNVTASVELIDSQDATCTAAGYKKYKGTVTFENNSYYDEYTVTIPATGHSYGEPVWTWAEDGSGASAKFICTANDDEQNVTASVELIDSQDATCTADGYRKYKGTVIFENNSYYDEYTVTIPAAHSYGEPVWTWSNHYGSATATFKCTGCDDEQTVNAVISEEIVSEPDCEHNGSKKVTATVSFNGREYSKIIDVTIYSEGHSYSDPAWNWSDDLTSAQAVMVCEICYDRQVVDARVTESIVKEPTYNTEGLRRIKAQIHFNDMTYTDSKDITIPVKKLQAPAITRVEPGNGKMNIKWEAVEGAESYKVYFRNGDSIRSVTRTGTGAYIGGISNGVYEIWVTAVNGGNESAASDIKTAELMDYGVECSTRAAGSGTIEISWEAYTGATRYRVVCIDKDNNVRDTKTTSKLSFKWTGLHNGEEYGFYVQPYVDGVYPAFTRTDAKDKEYITRTVPVNAPRIERLSLGDSKAWLYYESVPRATRYYVYAVQDGKERLAGTTTASKFLVTDITNGADHKVTFYVKALVDGRLTPEKRTVTRYTRDGVIPAVKLSSTTASISWARYTDSNGNATKYKVVLVDAKNKMIDFRETSGTAFDWKGLKKGTKYGIYVVPYVKDEYIPFGLSHENDKENIVYFTVK